MRIFIRLSGGYAGFENETIGSFNTENFPKEVGARIEEYVEQLSQAVELTQGNEPIGTDMLHYEIELSNGSSEKRKFIVTDEGEVGDSLHKLLDILGLSG